MNEENKPSYYAIIPSKVRYCEELKFAERLLYGEIYALSGKEGYCFATNKYFARLYNVTIETISRWISHLNKLGFVEVEIIKNEDNEIIQRRIYVIDNTYSQENQYPYSQNNQDTIDQNVNYNNINSKSINNNIININKIDDFFYIKENEFEKIENMTQEQINQFKEILIEKGCFFTDEEIQLLSKDDIQEARIIMYAIKKLFMNKKMYLIEKSNNQDLITVYRKCLDKSTEYENTDREINNFFNYYYTSLTNELEKN